MPRGAEGGFSVEADLWVVPRLAYPPGMRSVGYAETANSRLCPGTRRDRDRRLDEIDGSWRAESLSPTAEDGAGFGTALGRKAVERWGTRGFAEGAGDLSVGRVRKPMGGGRMLHGNGLLPEGNGHFSQDSGLCYESGVLNREAGLPV